MEKFSENKMSDSCGNATTQRKGDGLRNPDETKSNTEVSNSNDSDDEDDGLDDVFDYVVSELCAVENKDEKLLAEIQNESKGKLFSQKKLTEERTLKNDPVQYETIKVAKDKTKKEKQKRSSLETDHIVNLENNSSVGRDNSHLPSNVKEDFAKGHIVEDSSSADRPFHCTLCLISLSGVLPLQEHVKSKNHIQRAQAKIIYFSDKPLIDNEWSTQNTPQLDALIATGQIRVRGRDLSCKYCPYVANYVETMRKHLFEKHKKIIKIESEQKRLIANQLMMPEPIESNSENKIFVKSGFRNVSEDDLKALFSQFGVVVACKIRMCKRKKDSSAVVEFDNTDAVAKAIKLSRNLTIKGNTLKIRATAAGNNKLELADSTEDSQESSTVMPTAKILSYLQQKIPEAQTKPSLDTTQRQRKSNVKPDRFLRMDKFGNLTPRFAHQDQDLIDYDAPGTSNFKTSKVNERKHFQNNPSHGGKSGKNVYPNPKTINKMGLNPYQGDFKNAKSSDIQPSFSNENINVPNPLSRIKQEFLPDANDSSELSSKMVADNKNALSSLNVQPQQIGNQILPDQGPLGRSPQQWPEPPKQIGNQSYVDHIATMEQDHINKMEHEMEKVFANEKGKRKMLNEETDKNDPTVFRGKNALDYSENRPGDSSSKNLETNYGSKRQKILPDNKDMHDKSKYNLFVRGLSIDCTKEEVKQFCSDYGIINEVHLEWCENPTFLGEKVAYVEFKSEDDVNSVLKERKNLYIKDNLIRTQRYIDPSKLNDVVFFVSGITHVDINTKGDLIRYFNNFGSVKTLFINTNSRNEHYAFVAFHSNEAATKIISTQEPYVFNKAILEILPVRALQEENTFENLEMDPPKVLIITENVYEILESLCLKEVDLELDTCVRILENMTSSKLYENVSEILKDMANIKFVIFVQGFQDLTKTVNTANANFKVPRDENEINEYLKLQQQINERFHNQFAGVRFLWTTPIPYCFVNYNRYEIMAENTSVIPSWCWKKIQINFNKCLMNLRIQMLESDSHNTVDFLKLFINGNNTSDDLNGGQTFLDGEISAENWFDQEDFKWKLNIDGGRALRYCIRKAVLRQFLWGSDVKEESGWHNYVQEILHAEQQERDRCQKDLKLYPLPSIEEIFEMYGAPAVQRAEDDFQCKRNLCDDEKASRKK